MRQDGAIGSSCFRLRQIFAHLFHDKEGGKGRGGEGLPRLEITPGYALVIVT